jgi:hypothetical protein
VIRANTDDRPIATLESEVHRITSESERKNTSPDAREVFPVVNVQIPSEMERNMGLGLSSGKYIEFYHKELKS